MAGVLHSFYFQEQTAQSLGSSVALTDPSDLSCWLSEVASETRVRVLVSLSCLVIGIATDNGEEIYRRDKQ